MSMVAFRLAAKWVSCDDISRTAMDENNALPTPQQ
jgi:hypothetical protein